MSEDADYTQKLIQEYERTGVLMGVRPIDLLRRIKQLEDQVADLNYVRECRDQWRNQVEGSERRLAEANEWMAALSGILINKYDVWAIMPWDENYIPGVKGNIHYGYESYLDAMAERSQDPDRKAYWEMMKRLHREEKA